MCIATGGNDLTRFRFNESVFTDWAHRNLVAAVRGGEKKTSCAIGRNIRHAVRKRRRRFLCQLAVRGIDGVAQYAHWLRADNGVKSFFVRAYRHWHDQFGCIGFADWRQRTAARVHDVGIDIAVLRV